MRPSHVGLVLAAAMMALEPIVEEERKIGPGTRKTVSGTLIDVERPRRKTKSDSLKRLLKK